MFNKGFSLILLILLIGFVSASCNSTQININTASAEDLDKIINVGLKTAGWIIGNRTYDSVDDLTIIRGIGNVTLSEIKSQGLACVENEDENENEEQEPEEPTEVIEEVPVEEIIEGNITAEIIEEQGNNDEGEEDEEEVDSVPILKTDNVIKKQEIVNLSPIFLNSLNSKNIKSEENNEIWKRNLSFYGIITFCVIFGAWFLLTRERNKNEFRQ